MSETQTVAIAIDLESNAAPIAADAANALEGLREEITANAAELAGMNKALRALKAGGGVADDTVGKLKKQIAASKATVAQQTAAYLKLGGTFKSVKPPKDPKPSPAGLDALAKSAKALPGPLGAVGSKLGIISGITAGGALAAGTVAFAVALMAVAAAATAAFVSLAKYALGAADARRNDELRLQGLSKYRSFWAEMVGGTALAADSSKFLQTQLDEVASSSALSREELAGMQAELYRAGLRSGNLQAALQGLADTEAGGGKEAAAIFKARALGAALYGQSIKALAGDAKARYGEIAKARMLSFEVQSKKLHENIAHLFDGLKIDGLLKAAKVVTDMFSQSSASGRALRVILESVFQPMLDFVETNGIYFKRFFQGIVIGALAIGIVAQKTRIALKEAFGDSEILKNLDMQKVAVYAGAAALGAIVAAALAGVVVFGVLAGVVAATVGTWYALGAAIVGAWNFIKSIDWIDLGLSVPRGIANGIRSGIGDAVAAMRDLALKPMREFKARMGINSPSKVAYGEAKWVPAGQVKAYEDGVPAVERSARKLGDASQKGLEFGYDQPSTGGNAGGDAPRRPGAGSPPPAAGAVSITVESGAIVIQGGGRDASELADEVLSRFEERLVGVARHLGAAP